MIKIEISIRQMIFIICSICWMLVIFFMSGRNAEVSTKDSHFIGMTIGSIIYDDFEDWTTEEQLAFAKLVDHPVRKTAHGLEYAILAVLFTGSVFQSQKNGLYSKRYWWIWLCCIGYAITDEVHQYFVPGRACRMTDVCIDAGGALVGLICALAIMKKVDYSMKKDFRRIPKEDPTRYKPI